MFSRVYIWSPSIEVDDTWKPIKDYIRDHIKPSDRDKYYFDSYDPAELQQVITTQQKVIDYQKEQRHKGLYQILICIDDFADNPGFTRKSQLLHQLYIRTLYDSNNNFNTGLEANFANSEEKHNSFIHIPVEKLFKFIRNHRRIECRI